MIARVSTIKGSAAGMLYQSNEEKADLSKFYNLESDNPKEQFEEMREVTKLNQRTEKPMIAVVLSPDKSVSENLTSEDWQKLAEDFAKEMNFKDNQWRWDLHTNTDEKHIHIYANRIDFCGNNTVKASNIGRRSGVIADKLAKDRGWKTAKEIGLEKRKSIANALISSVRQSKSWNDLARRMESKGFIFELSQNSKGINGARIIPIADYKPVTETAKGIKTLSKQGYKLSQIAMKSVTPTPLKIADIALSLRQNSRSRDRGISM